MSDPITIAVLAGAAAGGAAGKFTEIAIESGKNWIGKYFNNHQPKAQEKAEQNGFDFLIELGTRIKALEECNAVTQEKIEKIQEDPDFSAALQKALISSAQTENKEKHQVLAEILSQRLTVESESLVALTSKMALDVVSFLTPHQLNILKLTSLIYSIGPQNTLDPFSYETYLINTFTPYFDIKISSLDLMHLESLSCLKRNPMIGKDLRGILTNKNFGTSLSFGFYETEEYKKLESIWQRKLEHIELTSVGTLIAISVFNLSTEHPIDFSFFEDQ